MKKTIILLLLTLSLASCGAKTSPLEYQKNVASASFTLVIEDEEFGLTLSVADGRLDVTSPECLRGAAVILNSGKTILQTGDVGYEIPERFAKNISPVLSAFSLPDDSADVAVAGDDRRVVTVPYQSGEYKITLGDAGLPEEIEFKGERPFVMTGIRIEK